MISNIGAIINYASQLESTDPASQAYLWFLSRLDINKFVQRSIVASRMMSEVRMVAVEYSIHDYLPCGMPVREAVHAFSICSMLNRMLGCTFVYERRKPMRNWLSTTRFQIMVSWNATEFVPSRIEPYHEFQMKKAYDRDNMFRKNYRIVNDEALAAEHSEDIAERLADFRQEIAMNNRLAAGLISPMSTD